MQIFLTGATGFLGGELLVELAKKTEVDKVFCLVRAQNEKGAMLRLKKVFELHDDYFDAKKIIPIVGELKDSELATNLINNEQLKDVAMNLICHNFTYLFEDAATMTTQLGNELCCELIQFVAKNKKIVSNKK